MRYVYGYCRSLSSPGLAAIPMSSFVGQMHCVFFFLGSDPPQLVYQFTYVEFPG